VFSQIPVELKSVQSIHVAQKDDEYKGSKQPKEGQEIKIIAKQRCSLSFSFLVVPQNGLK